MGRSESENAMSNVPPKSMRDLRPSESQFVDAMRRLGHGRFESVRIQRGELVLEPPPTAVRSVKFGKPTPNRPQHPSNAFDLKQEGAQLFEAVRGVDDGGVRGLEVRGGGVWGGGGGVWGVGEGGGGERAKQKKKKTPQKKKKNKKFFLIGKKKKK